jgi:hypothetical protein
MKSYVKLLILIAVAVPVFIELRTLSGMLVGYNVSLPASIVVAVVVAIAVFLIDENVSFGGSKLVDEK